MKWFLLLLSIVAGLAGLFTFLLSGVQALLLWIIAAVLLVGAAIVEAINQIE
jgi:uncharacterized membrane protein HdeD (DUF308 family)